MLTKYIDRALRRAKYRILDDGTFVGTVPGLRGVLAHARSLEKCRSELAEVVEGWVLVRVARGLRIPPIGGARVEVKTVA
jgi:predicted RNase H-like HicB family nuclease